MEQNPLVLISQTQILKPVKDLATFPNVTLSPY